LKLFNIFSTYARYVKVYFVQRLSIFKLKFGNIKNYHIKGDKTEAHKSDTIRSKENSISLQFESSTLKTGSLTKKSNNSTDPTIDSFGITDPVLYFKKLNTIINKVLLNYNNDIKK